MQFNTSRRLPIIWVCKEMSGMIVPVVIHIEDSIGEEKLHILSSQHHSKTSDFPLGRDREKQYQKSQEKLKKKYEWKKKRH